MSNGRPWLPQHTATLRRMNAVGYTDGEIAAVTGHRRETVTRRRIAMGLSESRRVDWWVRKARIRIPQTA